MNISAKLTRKIEDELKDYITNSEPNLNDLRKIASDQGILPVLLDMGGCYAIRPNGEIVSFSWDKPFRLEVESKLRNVNAVLFAAVEKYPKLAELRPVRSSDSVQCSYCKGTGVVEGLTERGIRCYCGGLGWLPAVEE